MSNVIYLAYETAAVDFTQPQILEQAAKLDLTEQSMVIGFGANRDVHFISSTANIADIIYLLERVKKMVMDQDC